MCPEKPPKEGEHRYLWTWIPRDSDIEAAVNRTQAEDISYIRKLLEKRQETDSYIRTLEGRIHEIENTAPMTNSMPLRYPSLLENRQGPAESRWDKEASTSHQSPDEGRAQV